jgi:DNA modification methylase
MEKDLKQVNYDANARVDIYEADARDLSFMDGNSVDVAFTSPPYLNNYDYADRTRLELYFLGWASSWREITEKIRNKLIVSCSHQAKEMRLKEGLMPDNEINSEVRENLIRASEQLRAIKREKSGKKDYDIMIIAYFNDMLKTMREVYRVLRQGAYYGMVVGDSAPYGVYIPTDEYLAKIGRDVGFRDAKIFILRRRGSKWKYLVDKKIRHNVQLRESLILFKK